MSTQPSPVTIVLPTWGSPWVTTMRSGRSRVVGETVVAREETLDIVGVTGEQGSCLLGVGPGIPTPIQVVDRSSQFVSVWNAEVLHPHALTRFGWRAVKGDDEFQDREAVRKRLVLTPRMRPTIDIGVEREGETARFPAYGVAQASSHRSDDERQSAVAQAPRAA